MSDTPKLADESKRMLDNGVYLVMFRNQMGTYTACALRGYRAEKVQRIVNVLEDGPNITDDFEPSQALYRLAEKQIGNIA